MPKYAVRSVVNLFIFSNDCDDVVYRAIVDLITSRNLLIKALKHFTATKRDMLFNIGINFVVVPATTELLHNKHRSLTLTLYDLTSEDSSST